MCHPYDDYACVHGMGYTTVKSTVNGIAGEVRSFVNESDPAEIHTVVLANHSQRTRTIRVFSFVEFSLDGYSTYSDYDSYVYTEYDKEHNLLLAYNNAQERPHGWYHGFIASDRVPVGYDSSRRAFIGPYGSIVRPQALMNGHCSNSLAACETMVGVLEHRFSLKPGEKTKLNVLIGACDGKATALHVSECLLADGRIEEDFANLLHTKQKMVDLINVQTPDAKVNNLINNWTKQQVQLCAEVGRATGKGFRDQLQDSWAVVAFNPQLARDKILETIRHMYRDGRCVRGWLPLDPHIYSDGPTWIAPTINFYLKESGDFDFLNEKVGYLDGDADTVWEHMLTAVRYSFSDVGERGLVLAHDGDWNDSLNGIGTGGKGESVWTSIALCLALDEMADMAGNILRDESVRSEMELKAAAMRKTINEQAWDGEWYLAAYNDRGMKVGSHLEKEGKIYLNSQTWAVLANVADDERRIQCMESVKKYLDSDYGSLTLYPSYTSYNPEIGRLTGFVPGIWENGTPYCHGATFKVVADCCMGEGNEAYKSLSKIMPDSQLNPSDVSGCEPYVFTNMYFGPDNPRAGQTNFAWVTGTAGWMFRAVTQYVLGFHPGYNTIRFAPCVPSAWTACSYTRTYRGDIYRVTIQNPDGRQAGVKKIMLDGVAIAGDTIGICADGKCHEVVVSM